MPLEDFFCQEPARGEILGEEVNETAIFAKYLPAFPGELF
jgi:hypothetical protein